MGASKVAGFKFERHLPHQEGAVNAVMGVLNDVTAQVSDSPFERSLRNPKLDLNENIWIDNVMAMQARQGIDSSNLAFRDNRSRVLDVSMETGTGKTYTYAKTLFELNQHFGLCKFIVVVPSLSIKAGTVNFLNSDAAREHFRQDYGVDMQVHVLESKKGKNKGKSFMPPAVTQFVQAAHVGKPVIDVLVVNVGMLNSPTMQETFDVSLFEQFHTPLAALLSVNPVTIVDEPHKFPLTGKFWASVQALQSQLVIRYGATFNKEYTNLIYELTAVDSFNEGLVKGILAHVEDFKDGEKVTVKLLDMDGTEATFELNDNDKKSRHKLTKKDNSLAVIHPEMAGLFVEKLNKKTVVLSNGLELKKKSVINPYSFSMTVQQKMMQQAVRKHFELERDYLTREVRIKPLTLFFIDDIEGYRAESHEIGGELKTEFEALLKAEIERRLQDETDTFYREYLEKSLRDLSATHGGYFSKDNSGADEKVVQEVEEILHDKEALLSLGNPRRFIFSKWTLREGWDNPNVFQICKLRSSGSQTSKLQEVGRGLRLPVNEYMSRVKDESFDLHYYVDFTESGFVEELIGEINEKSRVFDKEYSKLTDELIERIVAIDDSLEDDGALLELLDDQGIINRKNEFKEGGLDKLKSMFPQAFGGGVSKSKVRKDSEKQKTTMRAGRYDELKALWETINQQVILEYRVEGEKAFKKLLLSFFKEHQTDFQPQGSQTRDQRLTIRDGQAFFREESSIEDKILPIRSMPYRAFLLALADELAINVSTLHDVFTILKEGKDYIIDINDYLSVHTITLIKGRFDRFVLDHALGKVTVGYQKVSNHIHPTYFTDANGQPKNAVNAGHLGVHFSDEPPAENYLFEDVYFDSELEKENIIQKINEVIVFTKIPKQSIRIPVAGGFSYSPDFAYVIKRTDGSQQLNLVVETKDKDKRSLFVDEEQKIKHAEQFFNALNSDIEVKFQQQNAGNAINEVIKECFA